jgi:hypothetical protein
LFFGLANTAERRAETDTYPVLRLFAGILNLSIIECQLCRYDCELRVAVESLQTVRRKKFLWIPITYFAGRANAEDAGIKTCNAADATFFRQNCIPKILASVSYAGNWPNSSDNSASLVHAVTLFVFASTYDFMQRSVLFAT